MDSKIQLIQKRIEDMDNRIYGSNRTTSIAPNLADRLVHINQDIMNKIQKKENIKLFLNDLLKIEDETNTNIDNIKMLELKYEIIDAGKAELKRNCNVLQKIDDLKDIINEDTSKTICSAYQRIAPLVSQTLDQSYALKNQTKDVHTFLLEYQNLHTGHFGSAFEQNDNYIQPFYPVGQDYIEIRAKQ